MVKKGRYRLFSYFIENQLIFYKSLKKNNKIIAFAIFEYLDFKSIELALNDFLRKQIIHYLSIQIDTNEKVGKILLLNFEDYKKENIIKSFNLVQQKLKYVNYRARFLKNNVLEKRFMTIFYQYLNSKSYINKSTDSIIISSDKNSKILNFFSIDLDSIEKKESFVSNFVSLINNIGKKGILIFHFKIDYNENIKILPYFIMESGNNEEFSKIEEIVNNFFHCQLLKRQEIKIKSIFNFIWRLGITDEFFILEEYQDLFSIDKNYSLFELNEILENNLKKNQIEYIRLSKNLLFIEQSYVFLILENLESGYIHRIIEKYYPKYFIYILILNEQDYQKLINIKAIKLIENVKMINPQEIQKLNFVNFKNKEY